MTEAPKRKYTLTLEIGGDELNDLIAALRNIEFNIHNGSTNVTTGGFSWGGWWKIVEQPNQTHDGYFAEVDTYLADRDTRPRCSRCEMLLGFTPAEGQAPICRHCSQMCPRCGSVLNNLTRGISVVVGGVHVCTVCLRPGETEIARAR